MSAPPLPSAAYPVPPSSSSIPFAQVLVLSDQRPPPPSRARPSSSGTAPALTFYGFDSSLSMIGLAERTRPPLQPPHPSSPRHALSCRYFAHHGRDVCLYDFPGTGDVTPRADPMHASRQWQLGVLAPLTFPPHPLAFTRLQPRRPHSQVTRSRGR